MKPLRILIILCLVALLTAVTGCRQETDTRDLLTQASALIAAYPDSTKAYEDLLRAAIREAEAHEQWGTCARAYLLLSRQVQWTREDEALTLARQALHAHERAATQSAQTDSILSERLDILLAMAGYLQQTGDYTQARVYLNNVRTCAKEHHLFRWQNAALGLLANLCLNEGRPQEALTLARQMQLPADSAAELEARFILANCYLQCDSLEAARRIYRSLDTRQNSKAHYVALRHLAEIAMLQGDYEHVPDLVDTAFASAEAVFFQALRQKDAYHRANLEQERQAERLVYHNRLALWALAAVTVIAVLVIAFIVTLNRHRRAMQQQRLLQQQREARQAADRQQREAREAARQLEQQEAMIHLLQNFIIEKSEVIQRLRTEGNQKIRLSQQDWKEVEQTLDSITGGFVQRLRKAHPTFQEEDIQLCMLTRMNLTNQAIAAIYLITVSAVKHRKLKLKKDGFGETDPSRPLDAVLADI